MSMSYMQQRNGVYYFRMVVPTNKREKFGRKEILISLRTRDKKKAVVSLNSYVAKYTELFSDDALIVAKDDIVYKRLAGKAEKLGISYLPAETLQSMQAMDAVSALSESLMMLKAVGRPDLLETATFAGVAAPGMSLDEMFDRYQQLSAGKWSDLDERARDKKWNRYRQPVNEFKEAIGDIDVLAITPRNASDYAIWLGRKIEAGNLKSETAKKKLIFLNAMIEKVFQSDHPERKSPFAGITIDYEGDKDTRKPLTEFEIEALEKHLLESDTNDELKAILGVLEYTGTHAKEIVLLESADIVLNAPVPHIKIRPNDNRKKLKTGGARIREIPLIGKALEAFKLNPGGFPRYCRSGGSEALSMAANKIIKQAAPGKTTYSYRHRMADLLRNADGVKDSMTQAIMGHNGGMTSRYGDGFTLQNKLEAMEKAFSAETKEKLKDKQKYEQ